MGLERTIVLDNHLQRNAVVSVIDNNWEQMSFSGRRLAVRIYEHKDRRTIEQNSLMWIRLSEISDQGWVGGRQYSAEVWHEQMKREFLPDEDGPTKSCRKGYRKWTTLPNGNRVLIGSTSGLTTYGMSEYLEKIMAFGSGELGVRFSPTPSEMAAA